MTQRDVAAVAIDMIEASLNDDAVRMQQVALSVSDDAVLPLLEMLATIAGDGVRSVAHASGQSADDLLLQMRFAKEIGETETPDDLPDDP